MDASAHFRGKNVTLMGLGLLGRGVGDAAYLAECGADLIVTDLKTRDALASSLEQLERFSNIRYVLGEHKLEDFKDRDLVIKAAGVPLDSPFVAEAKKNGIPVRMSADLFMEYSGISAVGVTGTRGKSTVAHMIAAVFEAASKKVLLGGNVRGVSTLALLSEATPDHVAVLELDSWQCQGLADAKLSPHIAVFTTFYNDHLNYYKNDVNAYLADKANIFLFQTERDNLIVGAQAIEAIRERYQDEILADLFVASEADLPSDWHLKIPGEHNRYNAALALAAARASGIPDEVSQKALESFMGVPGRLEFVREIHGVKIYNDTTATSPDATIVALRAVGSEHTHLIAGGTDKLSDLAQYVESIRSAKDLYLLAGSGTERLRTLDAKIVAAPVFDALLPAVHAALSNAVKGDVILLSPGFSSKGMFLNEYDRGDQFNAIVKAL